MKTDGKQLEALVAFVEKTLLPRGFDVKTNHRVFNDEGVQIAEFDIEVRGKVGSTDIAWLIECRDRPANGAAPGSWIEQLVGRRSRFGFNKVTAVSTTGFAAGAAEFARSEGIEIREVKALAPDEFADWLLMRDFLFTERRTKLHHASILIDPNEDEQKREELAKVMSNVNGDAPVLKSLRTEECSSLSMAFLGAAKIGNLFDDIEPNGPGKRIRLHVNYSNENDRFVVETKLGAITVQAIIFIGELSVCHRLVPLTITAEYRKAENGSIISQVASFAPQEIHGSEFSLEMHKLEETGETHVVLRKV
jgi:hypothetical protein